MADIDLASVNERVTSIEQRERSNQHRIDELSADLRELRKEQQAIYKIVTSVELIAQRMSNIEEKVDSNNAKLDEQSAALHETERRLSERITDVEHAPSKKLHDNYNSIKVAVITAVATLLATGAVGAIVALVHSAG